MSLFSLTQDQFLWFVAIGGSIWVCYTMFWGAGTVERSERDNSFGFFDGWFD